MFDRLHRHGRLIGIGLAAALLNACGGGGASSPETEPFYLEEQEEWTLVWADEFNGSSVDAANWTFQTGDGTDYGLPEPGWGNGERQFYLEDNAAGGRWITCDYCQRRANGRYALHLFPHALYRQVRFHIRPR